MSTQKTLYWEDFEAGQVRQLGERSVSREEIIAFAAEFDPQPMHMDEMAAKDSMLGGLAASGWHSCAMLMRMMCDGYLLDSNSMGSPGLDEIKFAAPVRPGDRLRAQFTCLETRASQSRPEMGVCKMFYELFNQHGELVMTWHCNQFFRRRTPGDQP